MKKKILVADDDDDTLLLLSMILNNKGYEVQSLKNAAEIVNGLDVWPDLFILDKHMALIDGIAVCKFLRLHAVARNIPILMISGCNCKGRATAAGADYYIEKPLDVKEFLAVVDQCMQSPKSLPGL